MKIHYFQRYHTKENVSTANTMLLLSRLYQYSPDRFFLFLKQLCYPDSADPFESEIAFEIQEKNEDSIPDAIMSQRSFKIVVETKLSDWFHEDQLLHHLSSFQNEEYKVLLTLAPTPMSKAKKQTLEQHLTQWNTSSSSPVRHINTTFADLTAAFQDVLDDQDTEMQDVLDDFLEYCAHDGLFLGSDSWKYMKMQLSGKTFDGNVRSGVYFNRAASASRPHDYIGLYRNKTVAAIGKICARITAEQDADGQFLYTVEQGELTEKRERTIRQIMEEEKQRGNDLFSIKHRYFFVEKFYETDFPKRTLRAPMGPRIFDLTQVLNTDHLPDTAEIARRLREKSWE